jgi:hypothetical protein
VGECNLGVERQSSMCKALGSIPSTTKIKTMKLQKKGLIILFICANCYTK